MSNLREAAQQALEALRKAMQGNLDFDEALSAFRGLEWLLAQLDDPLKRLTEISEDLGLYDLPDDKALPAATVQQSYAGSGHPAGLIAVLHRYYPIGTVLYEAPQPPAEQHDKAQPVAQVVEDMEALPFRKVAWLGRDLPVGTDLYAAPQPPAEQQELTTQEVADILNVSRPFVIKEIQRGNLKCHMVGSHRRIQHEEMVRYRDAMKADQEQALQELSDESQPPAGQDNSPPATCIKCGDVLMSEFTNLCYNCVHPLVEVQPPAEQGAELSDETKDAMRYRHMRSNARFQDRNGPGVYWYLPSLDHSLSVRDRLDRAIDAAIAADRVARGGAA